jgi:putative hydrolase of the HAD superfamily
MDKVLFFDVGGTLIRTAQPVGFYYAAMASHYGVKAEAEELQAGFKKAWKKNALRDPVEGARVKDDKAWWKSVVKDSWAESILPESFPFDDYFEELYAWFERPELWRVYPEVEGVLEELRSEGVRMGVLSNWDRRLRTILKGLELDFYFEAMLISSELGVEKPHRLIFDKALECFQIKAGQAVLIGDEEVYDQAGAIAAGWNYALVRRPEKDLRDALAELRQKCGG